MTTPASTTSPDPTTSVVPTPTPPPLDLEHLDHRQVARVLAVARCVLGATLVLAPKRLGRIWIGGAADDAGTRLFIRAMGARDLALAVGTLHALARGSAREWVLASAASDAVDATATVLAVPGIGLRRALPAATSAGLAALAGFAAWGRVD